MQNYGSFTNRTFGSLAPAALWSFTNRASSWHQGPFHKPHWWVTRSSHRKCQGEAVKHLHICTREGDTSMLWLPQSSNPDSLGTGRVVWWQTTNWTIAHHSGNHWDSVLGQFIVNITSCASVTQPGYYPWQTVYWSIPHSTDHDQMQDVWSILSLHNKSCSHPIPNSFTAINECWDARVNVWSV